MFSRFLPSWSTASVCAAGFLITSITVGFDTDARTRLDAGVLAQSRGGNPAAALAPLSCFENGWGPYPCAASGADCVTCSQDTYTGLGVGGGGYKGIPAPQTCGHTVPGKCITDSICLPTGFQQPGFCQIPGTVVIQ